MGLDAGYRDNGTVLEQSRMLKRRKDLYEAKYPETANGKTPGNQHTGQKREKEKFSFSQDTATKTGKSDRDIQLKTRIGGKIAPELDVALHEMGVSDHQSALLALIGKSGEKLTPDEQKQSVEAARGILEDQKANAEVRFSQGDVNHGQLL
jgi:hypothetical protein